MNSGGTISVKRRKFNLISIFKNSEKQLCM